MFNTKYRIVRDAYAGYEVQSRVWFSPFWFQCGFTNTFSRIEDAEKYAVGLQQPVVKVI